MSVIVDLVSLLTFCWATLWAVLSILSIGRGSRNSIHFVMFVFYVFFVLPLLLDILIGRPDYFRQPGFTLASQNDATSLIYCGYVAVTPVIWWATKPKLSKKIQYGRYRLDGFIPVLRRLTPLWYLLLIAPTVLVLFAPQPSRYLQYGAIVGMGDEQAREYHAFLASVCLLSLVAALALLLSRRKLSLEYLLFILIWLMSAAWINGKRHFVAYMLVSLGLIFWQRRTFTVKTLVYGGVLVAIVFLSFSTYFLSSVKGINMTSFPESYTSFRIDYGRDDVVKMTIYAELHPEEMNILEYRGQSLLFNLTMFVPREFWPDKPLPYAQYFTSAMLQSSPRFWGWGMTTSWLEEAIANFGWFGILIGPLTIAIICRIGDKDGDLLVRILTVLVASLLLVVELVAFMPLFLLWVLLVLWRRLRPKNPLVAQTPRTRRPSTSTLDAFSDVVSNPKRVH